ncbi:MAG: hypothetical protein IPJ14_17830 [Kineosporiaceae bacterium]|nr:hypothetical protein [Kineosporiaceae bacterium]MBK8077822.1 hypothetical protein [Kineosporiaceae bacterium]
MSVALTAVVRVDRPAPPAALFDALTRSVERLPEHSGTWSSPAVHRADFNGTNRVRVAESPGSGAQLRDQFGRLDAADVRLAASTLLRGRRFPAEPVDPDEPPPQLALRVAVWGPAFRQGEERDDGAAWLTFDPVWPFHTPGGEIPAAEAADRAGNRDLLVRLVQDVVVAVDPASVRLHTDVGDPLPFNAHLAYYRDVAQFAADLAWIEELWVRGSASRRVPPLSELSATERIWPLHEWRTAAERERVLLDLERLVAVLPRLGPEQLTAVQVAGSCPVRPFGPGFLVLSGAAFVDGFVDRFFTELADVVDLGA